ncbi:MULTISPECIES: NAD-binding protein [unclassified Methylocystis]|jgi:Trk K+ transport system NAD-binding subunit|uniref:potassium channel family protein n=1 Tax=unclassified Methylocystis TaxID=2625913 RepID=UPI001AED6705|nr:MULTISPECIES: NAD-binding protein [unclassified Methylocystis]
MMSSDARQNGGSAPFLICGLGDVGRQCIRLLRQFDVKVIGVDSAASLSQEDPGSVDLLERLIVGDCCRAEILEQAGIVHCRAALMVTENERANIMAAFAARSLNPNVRLIIRSAQGALGSLLQQNIGNLFAFEPTQFLANAFALASPQGLFEVAGEKMRLTRIQIRRDDRWKGRFLYELSTSSRRILSHARQAEEAAPIFASWIPDDVLREGDTLVYLEDISAVSQAPWRGRSKTAQHPVSTRFADFFANLRRLPFSAGVPRAALASAAIVALLIFAGTVFYRIENPGIGWFDAFNVSVVLAFGGFDNVFGALRVPFPISSRLYLFSVLATISSAVFLGILIATLTERTLSARLQIARRRPRVPDAGHTVIVGMSATGRRVAAILKDWMHPVVGLSEQPIGEEVLPDVPILVGSFRDTMQQANVATAESVIVVTDDEIANLEASLIVRSLNANCVLIFRAFDHRLAQDVASLIPASVGIGDYAIAAEAITAAAFGENIHCAFHLEGRSVFVTEYAIAAGDTLIDRLLAEVAYGYEIVPILHRRGEQVRLIPSDDIRLEANDRLVALATMGGLKRVENGDPIAAMCYLQVDRSHVVDVVFDAANTIARISGCDFRLARDIMNRLPSKLAVPLYRQQGLRLVRELKTLGVLSRLQAN